MIATKSFVAPNKAEFHGDYYRTENCGQVTRVGGKGEKTQESLERFTDFLTLSPAFEDALKKAQHIG